jgi:exopolysaccharide production protein ExoZ
MSMLELIKVTGLRNSTSRETAARQASSMKTIVNIQVLRFIAAAMVLFSHVQHEILNRAFFEKNSFEPIEPVFWAGGVDIFFIISGFIMFYLHSEDFAKPHASPKFLVKRLVRIVPLYWLFTLLMIFASLAFRDQVAHAEMSISHIAASFLFIPVQNSYGWYYPVLMLGWTLNFEMLFYVIFCASLAFRRPIGVTTIIILLLILSAVPFVVTISSTPFAFWCNPIVLEFLFGMWLAQSKLRGVRLGRWTAIPLVIAGLAAMIAFKALDIPGHYWNWRPLWMGLPAFLICAGAILVDDRGGAGIVRRAASLGGDASYALYLSHPFAIGLTALLFVKLGVASPWSYVLFASISAIAIAVATHLVIERPILERLRKSVIARREGALQAKSD